MKFYTKRKLFLTFQFGRTALHVASRYGHVDVVNVLVKHGAILDMKNKVTLHIRLFKWKDLKDQDDTKRPLTTSVHGNQPQRMF